MKENQYTVLINSYLLSILLFAVFLHILPFTTLKIEKVVITLGFVFLCLLNLGSIKVNVKKFFLLLISSGLLLYFQFNINRESILVENEISYAYLLVLLCFICIILLEKAFFSMDLIMFGLAIIIIFNVFYYTSIYSFSSNTLGISHFLLTYIIIISISNTKHFILKRIYIFILFINIYLIILTNSRTAIISLIMFGAIYLGWNYIRKIRLWFASIIMFSTFGFTFFYIGLYKKSFAHHLNNYIIEKTGKGFFSGRNIIWEDALVIYKNGRSLLFGQGNNYIAPNFIQFDNYLHNVYIQILYQFGILGLLMFFVLILLIVSKINVNENFGRISYSFLLSIIVMQTFEGVLVLPNSTSGFLGWIILGLLINFGSNGQKYVRGVSYEKSIDNNL